MLQSWKRKQTTDKPVLFIIIQAVAAQEAQRLPWMFYKSWIVLRMVS
jgi:hypothetical protein